jgi:hypothetical protein
MLATLSYIVVFLICWWGLIFAIGAVTAIPASRLFGYDLFDAPTPIPMATVALPCFFVVYHSLAWGDLRPPFLAGNQATHHVQSAKPPINTPVNVSGGVTYEPPVVPIKISLTRNGVTVSMEGRVLTPFGKISAFTEANFLEAKTLTLVIGANTTVYELDGGSRYTVEVPNDLRGRTRIHTDGKGNIRVVVPQPVLHNRARE